MLSYRWMRARISRRWLIRRTTLLPPQSFRVPLNSSRWAFACDFVRCEINFLDILTICSICCSNSYDTVWGKVLALFMNRSGHVESDPSNFGFGPWNEGLFFNLDENLTGTIQNIGPQGTWNIINLAHTAKNKGMREIEDKLRTVSTKGGGGCARFIHVIDRLLRFELVIKGLNDVNVLYLLKINWKHAQLC